MSLEAAVAENTAALKELVDITKKLHALRADAIETVRGAAASPGKAKDKPADEKPADKPTDEKKSDLSEALTEVQRVVGEYVGAEGISEAERKARQGKVKEVLAHPKVNAKKVSEIPAGLEKAVIKAVTTLTAEGNVIKDETVSEDDEPDLMG